MSAIAIIMTEADLNRLIEAAVKKHVSAFTASIETRKELPLRLKVTEAAKLLGISVATFNRKYKHLKKAEGGSVYVLAADVVK